MSIADSGTVAAEKVRRVPAVVRLAPSVVEALRHAAEAVSRLESMGPLDGVGLLFGRLEGPVVIVEHVLPFSTSNEGIVDLADVVLARIHAFDHSFSLAKSDPRLSRLETLGWYSVSKDAANTLVDRDVEFKNRRFRRISDLLFLLKPGPQDTILAECYSKSSYAPFSGLNHRYGSATIPRESTATEAVQLKMASIAGGVDPVVLLRGPQANFSVPVADPSGPSLVRSNESHDAVPDSLPDGASGRGGAARARWIMAAGVLVLAGGITFTSVYLRSSAPSSRADTAISSAHLGMRVVPQGQNLWVTWDHKMAGPGLTGGVLLIHDGRQTHTVRLDSAELSNGSLLYRPISDRVLFELELQNDRGTRLKDSISIVPRPKTALQVTKPLTSNPQLKGGAQLKPEANKPKEELATVPSRRGQTPRMSAMRNSLSDLTLVSAPESIYLPPTTQTHPTSSLDDTLATAPSVPVDPAALVNLPQVNMAQMDLPQTVPFSPTPGESSSPSYAPSPTMSPDAPEPETPRKPRSVRPLPYVPAQLLTKVMPSADGLGAAVLERSMVELNIQIDKTGRVAHARIMHHTGSYSDLIEQASVTAVTQWTFEPAKDYGKEVASEYTVVLHFAPHAE